MTDRGIFYINILIYPVNPVREVFFLLFVYIRVHLWLRLRPANLHAKAAYILADIIGL